MSYDFAILSLKKNISDQEANSLYADLCDNLQPDVITPNTAINDLYKELTEQYPEVADLPDEQIDDSPWSTDIEVSSGHLIMSCVWSQVEKVTDTLLTLSKKHSLSLYDPQAEMIIHPNTEEQAVDVNTSKKNKSWLWYFNTIGYILFFIYAVKYIFNIYK